MKLTNRLMILMALVIAVISLGIAGPAIAQDLSDPATCMECHADADRSPPSNPDMPQVHNPEGGFFQEAHADFVCIDCHTYITDLEHEESAPGQQVDCLECHDEVPTKE